MESSNSVLNMDSLQQIALDVHELRVGDMLHSFELLLISGQLAIIIIALIKVIKKL